MFLVPKKFKSSTVPYIAVYTARIYCMSKHIVFICNLWQYLLWSFKSIDEKSNAQVYQIEVPARLLILKKFPLCTFMISNHLQYLLKTASEINSNTFKTTDK